MGGLVDYDYDFFDEYQSDVLADLPSIEQLIRLDDEVANKVTMPPDMRGQSIRSNGHS